MITEMTLIQKAVSKVFGDFVSKAVSDSVDVLKSAIKDADLDRKSYNQNLRTRLYQLMIDVLNRFTYNKYEKQDKLYYAAESILKGYISTKDNTDAVKSGLKMLVSDVNNDTCQEFLETLCGEICRDDNSDLYKEIDMLWKRRESKYIHGEFEKIDQNEREVLGKLNDLKEVLDFIKGNMNSQSGNKAEHYEVPIKNRAEEYADKWNKNVFLNDFNEEDENAGVNIKLKDIYKEICLPHYIWKTNTKPSDKLRNLLTKYIVNNDGRKMLLILGHAGIGKSTLITWIMANLVEKQNNIFVYQFASNLKDINWQGGNILSEILKTLNLGYGKLENKSLILDGFDEIYAGSDRERILSKLNQEIAEMNILKRFSLIITCRENYVDLHNAVKYDYITLQPWDKNQIRSFCEVYEKESTRENLEYKNKKISEIKINKILEKKEVFGIPLILYMVLALNVTIEENSSIVDVYDQIFSLKKGVIYNRCYDTKAHRINETDIKEHIYQISQRIAFWIFENNPEKAFIFQKDFKGICDTVKVELGEKKEDIQSDVLIGNYFKLIKHCEGMGTDELQFVHRSIYEYFVVVYFFESLHKLTSKEEVAGKLGELLKYGCLSEQILDFVKYKFGSMKEYNLSDITREVFNIMLRDGMTYHAKGRNKNVIAREMNIFSNMLNVVHLWNPKLGKLDNIVFYLQHNYRKMLNLRGVDLSKANLSGANLSGADLSGADLSGANLSEANLSGANLSGADLRVADLSEANLRKADLSGVDLLGANLIDANLRKTDLRKADLRKADLNVANLNDANLSGANLSEADLGAADLRNAHLSEADLSEADLSIAHLRKADLSVADLSIAHLSGADLIGAYLRKANLSKADLDKTIFDENQVNLLCEKYDLTDSRVYISKTREVISYKEYCIRKQRT